MYLHTHFKNTPERINRRSLGSWVFFCWVNAAFSLNNVLHCFYKWGKLLLNCLLLHSIMSLFFPPKISCDSFFVWLSVCFGILSVFGGLASSFRPSTFTSLDWQDAIIDMDKRFLISFFFFLRRCIYSGDIKRSVTILCLSVWYVHILFGFSISSLLTTLMLPSLCCSIWIYCSLW